jgi:hypothetical protein
VPYGIEIDVDGDSPPVKGGWNVKRVMKPLSLATFTKIGGVDVLPA